MGEIVNLRRHRKAKARLAAAEAAAVNRASFGRTRAEREAQTLRDTLEQRRLDGHKRPKSDGEE